MPIRTNTGDGSTAPALHLIAALVLALALLCAAHAVPAAVAGTVTIGDIPPVDVDWKSGSGQVWITLSNTSDKPQEVTLCGGICGAGAHGRTSPAQITLQGEADPAPKPILPLQIEAGKTKAVKLIVSGARQPGKSTGVVSLGADRYDFAVWLVDVPFKVGLQTQTGDRPELALMRDKAGLMVLTNEDTVGYRVHWCLYLPDNGEVVDDYAKLPPSGAVPVTVQPRTGWFRNAFQGLFKDDVRAARLTLQLVNTDGTRGSQASSGDCGTSARVQGEPSGSGDAPILPARTIPLQVSLAYWDTGKYAGYLILLLVLTLGAALSVVLNGWIPNYLARAALLRRLHDIAHGIHGISGQADSRLRVILRIHRMGLRDELTALNATNLDTADQLKQIGCDIEVLGRRVATVLRLDGLGTRFREFRASDADLPPTALDEISARLAQATEALCKSALQDADYTAVSAAMDDAAAGLDRLGGENPALAKRLADLVADLEALYAPEGEIGKTNECGKVRAAMGGALFEFLSNARYKDATQVLPTDYRFLDFATRKLVILRDYVRIAEAIAADPGDAEGRRIIALCWPRLAEQLRRNDCDSLRRARRVVRELDERVLPERIEQALQDCRATVVWDPPDIHPNQPVRLSVRFTSPELQNRAAQEEFTCEWQFPSPVGLETGWEITHYFRSDTESQFVVHIRRHDGELVMAKGAANLDPNTPLTLGPAGFKLASPRLPKRSDTSKAESLRLVLALGLAIMGLIAGAKDEFMKLDVFFGLLTVLMLGFSADTIKNLFGKRA